MGNTEVAGRHEAVYEAQYHVLWQDKPSEVHALIPSNQKQGTLPFMLTVWKSAR